MSQPSQTPTHLALAFAGSLTSFGVATLYMWQWRGLDAVQAIDPFDPEPVFWWWVLVTLNPAIFLAICGVWLWWHHRAHRRYSLTK